MLQPYKCSILAILKVIAVFYSILHALCLYLAKYNLVEKNPYALRLKFITFLVWRMQCMSCAVC